jgi:hypothetical protein
MGRQKIDGAERSPAIGHYLWVFSWTGMGRPQECMTINVLLSSAILPGAFKKKNIRKS